MLLSTSRASLRCLRPWDSEGTVLASSPPRRLIGNDGLENRCAEQSSLLLELLRFGEPFRQNRVPLRSTHPLCLGEPVQSAELLCVGKRIRSTELLVLGEPVLSTKFLLPRIANTHYTSSLPRRASAQYRAPLIRRALTRHRGNLSKRVVVVSELETLDTLCH